MNLGDFISGILESWLKDYHRALHRALDGWELELALRELELARWADDGGPTPALDEFSEPVWRCHCTDNYAPHLRQPWCRR